MGLGAEEVGVPDVEQPHQQRHVARRLGGAEVLVHRVDAGQQLGEPLRADRDHERRTDRGVHGVAAADPVPEAERVVGVDAEVGHLVERGRDRHEVLRDRLLLVLAREPVEQPRLAQPGVGQRLESPEGLAGDDEQRGGRVQPGERRGRIGGVDVADEPALQPGLAVGLQRLVGHHRPEVGAADADVDHGADPLAGDAGPGAGAHPVGELVDPAQHLVDVGTTSCPSTSRRASSGSRSAVCSTARSSVTLMCSPRNIASRRSATPTCSASSEQRGEDVAGRPAPWTGRRAGRPR